MGFTVQRMATGDSAVLEAGWAIVLDHEHIMFVGSYRQCEDWLDQHDVASVDGHSRNVRQTPTDNATGWRQCLTGWFQKRIGKRTSCSVPTRFTDLPKHTYGHCGAIESMALVAIFSMIFISIWQSSSVVAPERSIVYRNVGRRPNASQALFGRQNQSSSSSSSNDSTEIACDVAPADE